MKLLSVLTICLAASVAAVHATPRSAYLIGPRDVLSVRVFEEDDLNVEARVADDGVAELPIIGEVELSGLSEYQAAERIEEILESQYLQSATVSVEVIEYRSKPITILGAVNNPGTHYMTGAWDLFQALNEAGGLAANHAKTAFVRRESASGLVDQLKVDLDALMVRGNQTVNIPLLPDDVVNVPQATELTVFMLGEVTRPGAVALRTDSRATLLVAIARAGGLTERAAKKIVIKRQTPNGEAVEIQVHYGRMLSGKDTDPELLDGDLIVVKEAFL